MTEIEQSMGVRGIPGADLPIGQQIAMLRKLKKISVPKLARACDLAGYTVRLIEQGKVNPRDKTLARIFAVLGYEIERHGRPLK